MKRRPNVRYRAPRTETGNQETSQETTLSDHEILMQGAEAMKRLDSDSLRNLLDETAEKLFEDFGGKSLERRIAQHECSLDVYQQDLDRTMSHPEPDKFRWRIKPAESVRIGREIDAVNKQIIEMRERAWQMAKEMVEELMQQHDRHRYEQKQAEAQTQPATTQPEPQTKAGVAHGQTQPKTTPTQSSAHHETRATQAQPNRSKPVAA